MKRLFTAASAVSALFATPVVASAQCSYHVICRFHVTGADGGDRACVVYQSMDCSVNTMCAG